MSNPSIRPAEILQTNPVLAKGYAQKFARKNDIPTVFAELSDMVEEVDCALVHACD